MRFPDLWPVFFTCFVRFRPGVGRQGIKVNGGFDGF